MCDYCLHKIALLAVSGGANTNVFDVEANHRAEQTAKLARTNGFWSRLKVRVLG